MSTSKGRRLALARGVRFSCRQCGDCCRDFPVSLSREEIERFEAHDWTEIIGTPGPAVTHDHQGVRALVYLRRKADGTCLFLGPDELCEIHRTLGEDFKPLACRMFPFRVADGPAVGPRPVVSGHFACSSLAHGDGHKLNRHRKDLDALVGELHEVQPPGDATADPRLPFHRGLSYQRDDLALVFDLLARELENASRPFPQRILAASKFVSLVAGSRFTSLTSPTSQKAIRGFAGGIRDQVSRGLLAPPTATPLPQRLLFRSILAFAARRDPAHLLTAGFLRRLTRRFGNLLAGLTFIVGSGAVRCIGRDRTVALGDVRRRAPLADPLLPAADGALTRYFLAQITGRFLYTGSFQVSDFLPALGLLFRQYPVIILFARAACMARGGDVLERDDWVSAVRTADWNFGGVPWTSGLIGNVRAGLLADVESSLAFVPWCAGELAPPPSTPAKVE